MKIRLSSIAEQLLLEGHRFYERQATGIGDYFLDSLMPISTPFIFMLASMLFFHRLQAKRFPFSIYYRIEDDIIRVYAILDNRRNPDWIRKNLKGA